MSEILNKVRDVDPNNSDAIKEVLTKYFQNLAKHTEFNCNQWLRSLESIINRFPKYCSNHRATIEKHLTYFLDCSNYYNVIEAAKCAHALQQVQWPQEKQATSKSAWRDQTEILCNSAHSLIDALFNDSVDIYKMRSKKIHAQPNSTSPLFVALTKITFTGTSGSTNKQALLQTRLRNIFIFIQAMIVEIYPVAKPIRPQTILDVIVRSLSVTSGKKSQSTDVATVKIQALRTLDALTVCMGSNLIPFSPLVFRIVMQTLRWSSENQTEGSRQVRRHTYNSLCNWLTTLHVHRFTAGNIWEDELTAHIVGDTTPPKKIVQLTMSGTSLKNLSKKAKRKIQNNMLKESTLASHMPGEKNKVVLEEETNNEVALAALECAETFLSVCGVFLKPTTHKIFQEHIVHECYNSEIYSDEYLLLLLHVLEASRKATPSTVPPPTQYCLQLYSTLTNHQGREISKFCLDALLNIRLHLYCSPPTVNFALNIQTEKEKPTEKLKKISERNIAALKKFLGPDRMPPLSSNEEVVTISDEPVNKKPRLEEESDKISLSSESVCSVHSDPGIEFLNKDSAEIEEGNETNEITETNSGDEVPSDKGDESHITNTDAIMSEEIESDVNGSEIEEKRTMEPNIAEKIEEIKELQPEQTTINEIKTQQLQVSVSIDETNEDEQPLSMEVAYNFTSTDTQNVKKIIKCDDENLSSTNDTDDLIITCAQADKITQDNKVSNQKEVIEEATDVVANVSVILNGVKETNDVTSDLTDTSDKLPKPDGISIEDMLADFVDEVNEQAIDA